MERRLRFSWRRDLEVERLVVLARAVGSSSKLGDVSVNGKRRRRGEGGYSSAGAFFALRFLFGILLSGG